MQEAQDTIESAAKKTRTIERKLKNVSEISGERADLLLSDDFELRARASSIPPAKPAASAKINIREIVMLMCGL